MFLSYTAPYEAMTHSLRSQFLWARVIVQALALYTTVPGLIPGTLYVFKQMFLSYAALYKIRTHSLRSSFLWARVIVQPVRYLPCTQLSQVLSLALHIVP